MSRSTFSAHERKLQVERRVRYKGTARVRLEHMHFEWNETRELNRKNVERLKEVFRTENTRRLEPRNHIPAVVGQAELDITLQISKVSAETLLSNPNAEPPALRFPKHHRITCLHGRHRIQAARETLPPTDAWWVVDFYLKDSNPELRTTLIEEYTNEEKPSDGEIYRKIRQYEREGNICFKRRWKALLSKHGRRALHQLLNHREGELAAAFDNLLEIPGLWGGMRISTLHKIIGMKCDEEVIHYLNHIKNVWSKLLDKDKVALQRVDQATIFSAFSREERERLWRCLRSIDGIIPSLSTFFEDVKYLSTCADCLKRLIKLPPGDTISLALQRKFPYDADTDGQYVIEVAESTFVTGSHSPDPVDLGYRQLWAFAMRHYREMPPEAKKDSKDLLAKGAVEKADEEVVSEFAALADRLGFQSNEIQELKQRSSDAEIAQNALLKARKPDRYKYDKATLESHVRQIMQLFATATPLSRQTSSPTLISDNPNASGKRCGFPDEDSQQRDKEFLFVKHLHQKGEEQVEYITSFFVRQSVYLAFFGRPMYSDNGFAYEVSLSQDTEMIELERSNEHWIAPAEVRPDSEWYMRSRDENRGIWQQSERGRREQERLEQGRLDQERGELEQVQQARLEQERLEQERREQERLEQERLEQEHLKQDQLEQERLEQERLEQERLEQEQEQERLEQEHLEQERLEQERLEQERLEQERLEQERLEQERLEQERLEQEQLELERLGRDKVSRHRHTQLDLGSLVSGGTNIDHDTSQPADLNLHPGVRLAVANSSPDPQVQTSNVIHITYLVRERGGWRTSQILDVDPSDPSVVERVALKHMRKRIRLFDADLNILTPKHCFEAATNSGKNTILLIPEGDIDISEDLENSVKQLFGARNSGMADAASKRSRR